LVVGENLLFPRHYDSADEVAGLLEDLLEVVVVDGSSGHGSTLLLRRCGVGAEREATWAPIIYEISCAMMGRLQY
jgi:hypothetical protein